MMKMAQTIETTIHKSEATNQARQSIEEPSFSFILAWLSRKQRVKLRNVGPGFAMCNSTNSRLAHAVIPSNSTPAITACQSFPDCKNIGFSQFGIPITRTMDSWESRCKARCVVPMLTKSYPANRLLAHIKSLRNIRLTEASPKLRENKLHILFAKLRVRIIRTLKIESFQNMICVFHVLTPGNHFQVFQPWISFIATFVMGLMSFWDWANKGFQDKPVDHTLKALPVSEKSDVRISTPNKFGCEDFTDTETGFSSSPGSHSFYAPMITNLIQLLKANYGLPSLHSTEVYLKGVTL